MGTLGRAAAEMRMKKLTYIGNPTQLNKEHVFEIWGYLLGRQCADVVNLTFQEWSSSLNGTRSLRSSRSPTAPCLAGESGLPVSATWYTALWVQPSSNPALLTSYGDWNVTLGMHSSIILFLWSDCLDSSATLNHPRKHWYFILMVKFPLVVALSCLKVKLSDPLVLFLHWIFENLLNDAH